MRFRISFGISAASVAVALALTACTSNPPAPESGGVPAATVAFVGLTDGAEVASPLEVCLEATGVTIELAGEVKPGFGHHHLIIDPTSDEAAKYAAGTTEAIGKDDTHLHLGDGSTCKTVDLMPGEHELLAVVADGAHAPLSPPVVASVKVMVQ